MKANKIFRAVGNLAFIARTASDFTTRSSCVTGRINEDGDFEGDVSFSQGYHISASKAEAVETPTSWWAVKEAMERQSGDWTVMREEKLGAHVYGGYPVKVY